MNLKLNNNTNAQLLVTFNGVPTILKVDESGGGTKAKLIITVTTGGNIGEKTYIRINGNTITSTMIVGNDVSSVFLVPLSLGSTYTKASAYSIANAFNNTALANDYNIYVDNQVYGSLQSKVVVEAKEMGKQYNFTELETTATFITLSEEESGSSSDLLNGSKVVLDVYAESRPAEQTQIGANSKILPHIVTLQKNYYKDGISFDLSPVLATVTNDGDVTQYNVVASYVNNGQMQVIGELNHNYCVNGYSVNQGLYYIPRFSGMYLAQNVLRGTDKPTYNNTILYYLDGEPITLSFFNYELTSKNLTINYYDSSLNQISTKSVVFTPSKTLDTFSFIPTEGAYYVDVVTPNQGAIRYTNVKPLKYGNEQDYQMIYWRNEYGGTSFFPLTFSRTEERETEIEEYQKQSFDIYNTNLKELNKVYSRELEYTVELKTHYIPKDGTWMLYSLLHSYSAWTYVNDVKYAIIITDVQVNESNVNDIYQGTVKYKYSLPDTFY